MHPLFLTIVRRPDLVVDHLSAYTALLAKEASDASRTIVNRVLIWIMVVVFGCIGLGLAGIALMLGVLQNQFHLRMKMKWLFYFYKFRKIVFCRIRC